MWEITSQDEELVITKVLKEMIGICFKKWNKSGLDIYYRNKSTCIVGSKQVQFGTDHRTWCRPWKSLGVLPKPEKKLASNFVLQTNLMLSW